MEPVCDHRCAPSRYRIPVDPEIGRQVKAFRDYADYMDSDEFKEGLNELLELAEHGRPAIMCSEAVPWRCHRRLITDALIVAGAEVADIMSTTSVRPAALHKHAQVQDGHLTYPSQA